MHVLLLTKFYWSAYTIGQVDSQTRRDTSAALSAGCSRSVDSMAEGRIRSHLRQVRPTERLPDSSDGLAEWWQAQPVLTRAELQISNSSTGGATLVRTGGSTGEPVGVAMTSHDFRMKRARLLASREALGWSPGMPTFSIWGSDADLGASVRRRERVKSALSGIQIDGGFTGTRDRWHRVADRLEQFERPVALYGYTSLLEDFSAALLDSDRVLQPGTVAAVWNGAEPVSPRARDLVRRATGAPLHDFYGAREVGAIALQLSPNSSELTTLPPQVIVEVVDDTGCHVPEGQAGRVLVSALKRDARGTALTRYEIGDRAVAGTAFQFGHLSLRELTGRTNDHLRMEDGSMISTSFFLHAAKDFKNLREFQVLVRTAQKSVELQISLLDPADPTMDADRFRQIIASRLDKFVVTVNFHERIPRGTNGKLRQMVIE